MLVGLWDAVFAHNVEPLILHTLAVFLKVFLVWRCRAVVQIHQQINVFAKLGFRHDFMLIWGFILEHFGHILGFNSASKSIPELEIHHGGPMGASGRRLGTSDGHMGTPGKRERRSLRGWDGDFGGPYMSFGQSIRPDSLVAP